MLLLVEVQAQETFPSDYSSFDSEQTSLLSLSKSVKDSEDTDVSTETQQWSVETYSNSETLPSETPKPLKALLSTKTPPPPKRPNNICRTKCARKCMIKKVPILNNLCNKACRKKCILLHLQVIYKRKAEGYVINCYRKCIKKF
ncbi:hypothetical protein PTKIN_Ptkin10aG0028700 [Pterospermum kingtungense]